MTSQTEQHLSEALRDLVADQPFEPDLGTIERRGQRLRRQATVGRRAVGVGVAVAVAAVAVSVVATTHPETTDQAATGTSTRGTSAELVLLADDIAASTSKQTGDATMELGRQSYDNGQVIPRADLFADSGTYYFAHTQSGLPAQVAGHHAQGNGGFAREVAAAIYASKGDLMTARERMADAPDDPGTTPSHAPTTTIMNNWVWENSLDALDVGAGNLQVRAGILRLLSTVPEVSVTHTTTDGRQTLTLSADSTITEPNYEEALTVDAGTGMPIVFNGGTPGEKPSVTVTYQISRVTLADVAAGKF
jgi:hypothetical protein